MPSIISGPDAAVLFLHEELRSWRQRGIGFRVDSENVLSVEYITPEGHGLQREAQRYRSDHAAELRLYLAFVADRDPDDAIRHLEAVWHSRGEFWKRERVAMADEYVPTKIAPLKREETGLIRMLESNKKEGAEIEAKLTEVRNKIKETIGEGDR